jgi:hypothetical protein
VKSARHHGEGAWTFGASGCGSSGAMGAMQRAWQTSGPSVAALVVVDCVVRPGRIGRLPGAARWRVGQSRALGLPHDHLPLLYVCR